MLFTAPKSRGSLTLQVTSARHFYYSSSSTSNRSHHGCIKKGPECSFSNIIQAFPDFQEPSPSPNRIFRPTALARLLSRRRPKTPRHQHLQGHRRKNSLTELLNKYYYLRNVNIHSLQPDGQQKLSSCSYKTTRQEQPSASLPFLPSPSWGPD